MPLLLPHIACYTAIIPAPFGALGLCIEQNTLVRIDFLPPSTSHQAPQTALAKQVQTELAHYFSNPHHRIALPTAPEGTAFQHRVWQAISTIPCGQTRSYGALAQALSTAPRALGQACGANPLPLIVPCHRVTRQHNLGGFAHAENGWLIETKKWLLRHEGAL